MSEPTTDSNQKHHVSVSQLAAIKMILHAARNPTCQVHGILVGSFAEGSVVSVDDAFPVFHSAPTKPILDSALRIAEAHLQGFGPSGSGVVGWYTSNERLGDDERAGQAALRIIGGIAAHLGLGVSESSLPPNSEPVLILVSNGGLSDVLCDENESAQPALCVFGRDNRKNWIRRIADDLVDIKKGDSNMGGLQAGGIVRAACSNENLSIPVYDFEDHIDGGTDSLQTIDWLMNQPIQKFVQNSG